MSVVNQAMEASGLGNLELVQAAEIPGMLRNLSPTYTEVNPRMSVPAYQKHNRRVDQGDGKTKILLERQRILVENLRPEANGIPTPRQAVLVQKTKSYSTRYFLHILTA
jgi:hypothetical protein